MKFYYLLEYVYCLGLLKIKNIFGKYKKQNKTYSGDWISKKNTGPDFHSFDIVD